MIKRYLSTFEVLFIPLKITLFANIFRAFDFPIV